MASARRRLSHNVEGPFFVDDTCIDCDTCRKIAPVTYVEHGGYAIVYRQPDDPGAIIRAQMALLACPTGSIGDTLKRDLLPARTEFPEALTEDVLFLGYTASSSFGAWSYLALRPSGNIMIDCPRFNKDLADRIAARGGIDQIFLTHQDDVADHERWSREFNAPRTMISWDVTSDTKNVEQQLEIHSSFILAPGVTVIPTPGHTRGHGVLLIDDRYLFSGDHLAWTTSRGALGAFRGACWYSWSEQIDSMVRLSRYRFEWVFPGHGRIHKREQSTMQAEIEEVVEWMRSVA